MTLSDAARSSLDALRANALRSLLTMLGIVIGVAAVIAMMAVGGGAREQVNEQIRSLGANLIQIVPGNVTSGGVRLGAGQSSMLTDDDAVSIIRQVPSVQVAAPVVRGGVQIVAGASNWSTAAMGVTSGYFEAREWPVETGRDFSTDESTRGGQVALLGQTVARNLFGSDNPVGESIRVRNVPFEVIGVMDKKGQTVFGSDQDDVIFLPLMTARQRVIGTNRAKTRSVNQITVKVREGENLALAEAEIRSLLRQRHRLQEGAEDDFQVRNLAEISATREQSARTLAMLLAAVAGVSLVVGGIGIMNIMLVSVTERTREIGVRMAVGARPRDVLVQFLIEATTLAIIGGAVGVALGLGVAKAVADAAGWPLLIAPAVIVLAVVFSGLVGVASGLYPAIRASRLDPVEALRTG
ncbi:MAG: ABC transporter permease [Proteobacteria bacterium]|nr:ABC transporter permease [Pseudomonadota bacterium]